MPALKCLREAQQLLLPARIAEFIIYKEYHISRKRQVFLNFQKFPIFHIIKGKWGATKGAALWEFLFFLKKKKDKGREIGWRVFRQFLFFYFIHLHSTACRNMYRNNTGGGNP